MASIAEIMQLCRLCLVKEQVNVPIFEEQGDIRQIFLKITACLPVKISREDNLPKKICNGCLYKLELLYQFWNTSTNAEKQLLSWLTAAGLDATTQTTQDAMAVVTQTQVVLKQEPNPEITENVTVVSDPGNFILQATQQPIEFPAVDFDYQDNFTAEQELANNAISADVDDSTESEPVAKRPRRTATATVTAPLIESEDDADDPGEAAVAAKTEEDSDDDTNVEPTFVDVAEDQDGEQPGPSGLGKIVEPSTTTISKTLLNETKPGLDLETQIKVENRDDDQVSQRFSKGQRTTYILFTNSIGFPTQTTDNIVLKTSSLKDNSFQCKDCFQVLGNKIQLDCHRYEVHSKDAQREFRAMYTSNEDATKFTCKTCNNLFRSRKDIEAHVQVHMTSYPCPDCDEVFLRIKVLARHSRQHSKEDMYHCSECDHKSKNYFSMMTHINVRHLKMQTYKCEHCEKSFSNKTLCKIHNEQYHSMVVFKCVVCGKSFQTQIGLLQHQRYTHYVSTNNSVNVCPICGRSFSNLITLRSHKRDHNRKHLCNVCGKDFKCISLLKCHMRIHTGETPYKCSNCNKSFRRIQYLRTHERVHTGEEPFKCEHCGKGFKQLSPLTIHRRLHTGERPFKCIICQKGFVTNALLKKHTISCSRK